MSTVKTGGLAFPYDRYSQMGMFLRDYFAAKAMQGFVSDPDWRVDMTPDETARAAYAQADAMLEARGE